MYSDSILNDPLFIFKCKKVFKFNYAIQSTIGMGHKFSLVLDFVHGGLNRDEENNSGQTTFMDSLHTVSNNYCSVAPWGKDGC